MIKISLVTLFVMTMATFALAASALPVPKAPGSTLVASAALL